MVDYFTSAPAMLNGRQVFTQFSNHGELRTDPTNRTNQQAHVALAQATDLYDTAQKGGPNCVLRVSIINLLFPVTIDVLYQVIRNNEKKLFWTFFGFRFLANLVQSLKLLHLQKMVRRFEGDLCFYLGCLDKFQALIQSKDPNGAAQAKLVRRVFNKKKSFMVLFV
jgi:hypothetical protein